MSNSHELKHRRIVVIGLDGTPFSFLKNEIEAGNMPHLKGLAARGTLARMDTEIPAVSSVAWSSFMTGVNPGKHGIFGFTDRKPDTWELYFPNYSNLQAEPIWDQISRDGGRCCVLNVPSTYPARSLNGVLVSGFVSPSLERAVYPAEAYEYLVGMGYRIDVDAAKGRESLDLLLEDLHETLEKRREAMLHFWRQEHWNFFMQVFTGTDRLHHFLWHHYEEADATYKAEFMRYYCRLDEILGEFISELPEDIAIFMLSDHGFCGIKREVFLNAHLQQDGLLSFTREKPQTIADVDTASTVAYCMDPGRIYLNRLGREPGGRVAPDVVGGIFEQVKESLLALKDPQNGEPVINSVESGNSLYDGPQADVGPELVAVSRRGYDLKGRMSPTIFTSRGILTGMHTQDDAFVFIDRGIKAETPAHIRELAKLILLTWRGQI